ncbi:non-canonical purine NTP pyrophosphatase [Helicobacter sp. 11S02629-2]|uniref:non-canonical purine NTP pyrophosphatase n=1 Tax=Helicobacter sp. 11S02629-2 TaxID=1476195 RepID=UPI000BA6692B|nr:non-canonical purine NTP pyrophosphatase [Helicobacter sp. 11S02629-2]PAF44975.1 hypothetical protein BKH40_04630 [Helicobacter sp. 11S02629-2]
MQKDELSKYSLPVVLATGNNDKLREVREILNSEVLSLKDAGIECFDVDENKDSFEGNAMLKVEALLNDIKLEEFIVIADDSGLSVEALDGAPGVYSARYAALDDKVLGGTKTDSKANCEKLKKELEKKGLWGSFASFECAIAYAIKTKDKMYEDRLEKGKQESGVLRKSLSGVACVEERGSNGFGYDGMFYPCEEELKLDFKSLDSKKKFLESHKSLGELDPNEKNKISHRLKALKALEAVFANYEVKKD